MATPTRYSLMNEQVDVATQSPTTPNPVYVTGQGPAQETVTRYTPPTPPTPPVPPVPNPAVTPPPTVTTPTPAKPTLQTVDENAIREETRKRMQASVDAINAQFASLISQENLAGEDRQGQTRAVNARSGLMGSDFGAAQTEKTTQFNKSQVQALESQKAAQLNAVLMNIEDRASAQIEARKKEALGQYERDSAEYAQAQEQARGDLQMLAKSGVALETLNPAQKAALLKQAGYDDPNFGELVYNAMKPKANQIDYKFEKLADGQGLFYGIDPTTGELITKNVKVDLPPDWNMQIAPDGTVIGYDKNTGQASILSGKGEFAKPQETPGLTPYQQFTATNDIQKNIQRFTTGQREVLRQFNTMKEAYDRLERGENKDLNATTQAIITNFNKILDPTSVVRESEYARSPEGQSLLDNLYGRLGKLQSGGAGLTKESLKEFVDLAKIYADNANASLNSTIEQQVNFAQSFGLNTSVLPGVTTPTPAQSTQLTPLTGPVSPNSLLGKYPYQEVAEYLKANPSATEADIRQGLQELGVQGFNTAGKPQASATLKDRNLSFAPRVAPVSVSIGAGAAVKNNNPGNLRNTDGNWMKFSTPEEGFKALMGYVERAKQGDHSRYNANQTLYQFFSVYAPSADNNNPKSYAETVAKNLGISANTKIGQIDTYAFAREIARHESSTKVTSKLV